MLQFDQSKDRMYVVIVEPDGHQMPNIYYRRLRKWGLTTRGSGDKELGPLLRRYSEDGRGGVIAQECCFVVPSRSLAYQIANLALEHGARNIHMGTTVLTDNITMSREDLQIMEKINSVFGQRGRPPKPTDWAVSCTECMCVLPQSTHRAIQCFNCGGWNVHSRKGKLMPYADPGGDVYKAWARTRFSGPHWEPVEISNRGIKPPPYSQIMPGTKRESEALSAIKDSGVMDTIREMDRKDAFAFLDAILITRAYRSQAERDASRLNVVSAYLSRKGDYTKISIIEEEPDLVDAALNIDIHTVVDWLIKASEESSDA